MTPERAKALLALPDDHEIDEAEAVDALVIVAGLQPEYDYEIFSAGKWSPAGHDFLTLEAAKEWVATRRHSTPARIVCRLVSTPEVVE